MTKISKINGKSNENVFGELPERVAGIDWNGVWSTMMRRRHQSAARECADIWADIHGARRYLRAATENNPEYFEQCLENIPLEKHFRILDIGSGPGVVTIPMARRVAVVTAVEPARGMADVLAEECLRQGIANVRCVRKRWEEVAPEIDLEGPYDVILAAFSLGMENLASAVEKMVQVSCGSIYLFWFAGTTAWETMYRDLWPRLHGAPYFPGPKADVIYNLLNQMGIYPNVTVFPFRSALRFDSIEEAIEEFTRRLGVEKPDQLPIVREFLESNLERDEGRWSLKHAATCLRFHWKVS